MKYFIYVFLIALLLTNCFISATSVMENRKSQEQIFNLEERLVGLNNKVTTMQGHVDDLESLRNEIANIQSSIDGLKVKPTKYADRNTDLSTINEISTIQMNDIIDYWAKKSGNYTFSGKGYTFIKASQETGLDPVYLLAHACQESAFGAADLGKHNYFGIGAYDTDPVGCSLNMGDSVDQGILEGAHWIKDHYYDQGATSLHLMIYGGKMYSTSRDKWIDAITSIMNESYAVLA